MENKHMKVTTWPDTYMSFATYDDRLHLRLHGGSYQLRRFVYHPPNRASRRRLISSTLTS
jgi:hypothetical protein